MKKGPAHRNERVRTDRILDRKGRPSALDDPFEGVVDPGERVHVAVPRC